MDLTKLFCKDAWDLKVVNTRTLEEELSRPLLDPDAVYDMDQEALQPQTPLLWYVALRGADRFRTTSGRYPGAFGATGNDDASLAADTDAVWAEMQALCAEQSVELPHLSDAYAKEIVRFGAIELHDVRLCSCALVRSELILTNAAIFKVLL